MNSSLEFNFEFQTLSSISYTFFLISNDSNKNKNANITHNYAPHHTTPYHINNPKQTKKELKFESHDATQLVTDYFTNNACKKKSITTTTTSTTTSATTTSTTSSNNTIGTSPPFYEGGGGGGSPPFWEGEGGIDDSNGQHLEIEFRNIQSSSHDCFTFYTNGHKAGKTVKGSNETIDDDGDGDDESSGDGGDSSDGEYDGGDSSDGEYEGGGSLDSEYEESGGASKKKKRRHHRQLYTTTYNNLISVDESGTIEGTLNPDNTVKKSCKKKGFNQPAYKNYHNTNTNLHDDNDNGGYGYNNKFLLPDKGIMMSTGNPKHLNGKQSSSLSTIYKKGGDDELNKCVKKLNPYASTYDACKIEFEFRCLPSGTTEGSDGITSTGSTNKKAQISFNYQFASEEYYEYVESSFNDAFAFFFNHENIALLPVDDTSNTTTSGDGSISDSSTANFVNIDTVNPNTHPDFFIGNDASDAETGVQFPQIEADGFTTILTATHETVVGEWNTLKMVIADVGDYMLDSWLLLEAGSFSCVEIPELIVDPFPPGEGEDPTDMPTDMPTEELVLNVGELTDMPTKMPTRDPTKNPTAKPTAKPTTKMPTKLPTTKPVRLSP